MSGAVEHDQFGADPRGAQGRVETLTLFQRHLRVAVAVEEL